ncbi:polyamine aminopropyltransferase [Nocardia panacis]|uniref:polyamine aminopropyltransferase n=1 Tax=Nocardia panacis TaxID=2340916 RepID=UPI00193AA936|nr:polyamine aminopropyltransferase [Nocardia panacis]
MELIVNERPNSLQRINDDLWLVEDDRDNMKISYRIKEVIFAESSDFQHIMILDSYDFGRMLVLDGVVQITSVDGHIYSEMSAHVPLSIHPNPERILIVGGGDCGVAREMVKYDQVKAIDMVEIDEMVVKVCREHLPEVSGNLSDPRVEFVFADGVEFVKSKKNWYDVIVVDSSDPEGPSIRLFEYDFYRDVRDALRDDGLVVRHSLSPLFNRDVMCRTVRHFETLFPVTRLFGATIPTFPGGFWSFTLGSKKYRDPVREVDRSAKYVDAAMLRSCFDLPPFLRTSSDRGE